MNYWQGKRAVITGATFGLGRALAGALVERGARVALVARGQEALDKAAAELAVKSGDVLAIQGDVTNAADIARLAATVRERWGGVDFFCHCAGRSMRGNVTTTSIDDFQKLWELNFLAAVRGVQAFAEDITTSRGHIVLIGSLAGKVAPRFLGAYPASKFPLAALAQQLRMELGPRGVHTLLVSPGTIQRDDAGTRYVAQAAGPSSAAGLPPSAMRPGGGARLKPIPPELLAKKILRACERRRAELIVPARARLAILLTHFSPRLGDWLLRKNSPEP